MTKRKIGVVIFVVTFIGMVYGALLSRAESTPTIIAMSLTGAIIGMLIGLLIRSYIVSRPGNALRRQRAAAAISRHRTDRAVFVSTSLCAVVGGTLGSLSDTVFMVMGALGGAWFGMWAGFVVAGLITLFTPSAVDQCSSIAEAIDQQTRELLLSSIAISALIGGLLGISMGHSVPICGVYAFFGLLFGPFIVLPMMYLYRALRGRLVRLNRKQKNARSKWNEPSGWDHNNAGYIDDWDDYRHDFPFYAAGDTDPVAKTLTGWTDASDISYHRDVLS